MRILLDSNILLRISEPHHPHHVASVSALRALAAAGHRFCIGSQTVSEFLAVATCAVADRGLGMDQVRADAELTKVTQSLEMLYDSKAAIDELRRLVVQYAVSGKSVNDSRLIAAMNVNGVSHAIRQPSRAADRVQLLHEAAAHGGPKHIAPSAVRRCVQHATDSEVWHLLRGGGLFSVFGFQFSVFRNASAASLLLSPAHLLSRQRGVQFSVFSNPAFSASFSYPRGNADSSPDQLFNFLVSRAACAGRTKHVANMGKDVMEHPH